MKTITVKQNGDNYEHYDEDGNLLKTDSGMLTFMIDCVYVFDGSLPDGIKLPSESAMEYTGNSDLFK